MDTSTGTESTSGNPPASNKSRRSTQDFSNLDTSDIPANHALSPEFSLLLLAARRDPSALHRQLISSLLDGQFDWTKFLKLAKCHGLGSRVYANLSKEKRLPESIRSALCETARQTAVATGYLGAELNKVQEVFDRRGVRCLAYKGPALAALLYGDCAVREFSDLDLLIRIEDFEKIREALESTGYTPEYRFPDHLQRAYLRTCTTYEFWSPNHNYHLELHWKNRRHPSLASAFDPEWLWTDTIRVKVGGREIETISTVNALFLLSLHAAKHGWEQLSWLFDIAELGARLTNTDWEVLWQRAASARSEKMVSLSLTLCNLLLQTGFADRVRPGDEIDAAAAAIVISLGKLQPQNSLLQLRLRSGLSAKLRLLRYLLVTPGMLDYLQFPVPRGFLFLYPAIRLGRLLRDHAFRRDHRS